MADILVIDDERMTREMLRCALEMRGHKVIEASNGDEALKVNRIDPCRLAVCDIIMPEKEGLETIMALRREFPRMKIIAISGGGSDGTLNYLEAAGKLGAQATLQKPFDLDHLFTAVQDLLEGVKA